MSASADLQAALEKLLHMPGALRAVHALPDGVPGTIEIVKRRTKDARNDVEAAAANHGLCIYAMPPLPTSALQGDPFVFFDRSEIRIRIVEQPAMNVLDADAYDILDDVATHLHWQPHRGIDEAVAARILAEPDEDQDTAVAWVQAQAVYAPLFEMLAILSHPLQIAERPAELVEDPRLRIIDVIFTAVYALNPNQS